MSTKTYLPVLLIAACGSAFAAPTVSVEFPSYFPGEAINASFGGGPGNRKDWVGIYPIDIVPGNVGSTIWNYVDNTRNGTVALTEGSVSFPSGLAEPGDWTAFFLLNDGYDVLAQMNFKVLEDGARLVRVKNSYKVGEKIEAAFFNGPGNAADWVGIYKDGQTPGAGTPSTIWNYVGGTHTAGDAKKTGTVSFPSGLNTAGKWVAMFLENDGYKVMASQPFSVVESTETAPRLVSSNRADKATNLPPSLDYTATIANGTRKVNLATIKVELDGATVAHQAVEQDGKVIINALSAVLPAPNSTHVTKLSYQDNGNPPAPYSHQVSYTIGDYKNIVLPSPLYFENFDSTAEGKLPAGWTEQNFTVKTIEDFDLTSLGSASYATWTVVNAERFKGLFATYDNTLDTTPAGEASDYQRVLTFNPFNVVNGKILTEPLAKGRFLFSTSGYRSGGNQVMYVFTPDYDLSGKTDVHVSFHSLWEQNQDSIAALEYSIDKGKTWLPVLYFLDGPDIEKVEVNGKETVDAVATFETERGDTATYDDPKTGEVLGGKYGAFIAAKISKDLAPFIQARVNDNPAESKRVELYRLPQADNQPSVRFRFAHAGTDSWYWGIDNFGLYSMTPSAATPSLNVARSGGDVTLSWPTGLAGWILESSETMTAGSWSAVASAAAPSHAVKPGAKAFFRLRKQ